MINVYKKGQSSNKSKSVQFFFQYHRNEDHN